MFKALLISSIYVLDQDKALDFYVGKLGLEVNTDQDLGFMRWLTVNVPGDTRHPVGETGRARPRRKDRRAGPRAGDERRHWRPLVLHNRRLLEDLRGASGKGRRVHRGANRATVRHRLRPA